jgi:hypothetical protein
VTPTWRNGRCGVDEILKRLDRVLVSEDLLLSLDRFRVFSNPFFKIWGKLPL